MLCEDVDFKYCSIFIIVNLYCLHTTEASSRLPLTTMTLWPFVPLLDTWITLYGPGIIIWGINMHYSTLDNKSKCTSSHYIIVCGAFSLIISMFHQAISPSAPLTLCNLDSKTFICFSDIISCSSFIFNKHAASMHLFYSFFMRPIRF